MNVIVARELSKQYGSVKAIKNISFTIEENKITGLIGRNGAGKTTLLKIMAGYLRETSGEVRVFNEEPFNHLKVASNMVFVDEQMTFPEALSLADILEAAEAFYENWDQELAQRLFEYFSFTKKQYHSHLSKGMRSTFNMIVGLAARCPLTIMDEPTSGMDSSVRKDFYRALLKDYMEWPRTIILSSHLLNEVEDILEDMILVKEGEIALHKSIAEVKEYAIGLRGNTVKINEFTLNRDVLHQRSIGGNTSYVVVRNVFSNQVVQNIRNAGIEVTPVSSDDLCVYLTNSTKGGIDDVFNRS
ncbi:ABC transporter [Anaerobacillus alkalilacustris]|uniref:ABC transporter n=1 Tax=Anaerobacillus alkalilacustris TaxID=393763 RepID=A0A1S2LYU4_9BACI|nr:ABC transporter ATP-binding protein [Anaerobacillus alkalilacustris]OIJ17383.1 ABC transporter [Anaerobacillus alkalilacustris]